MSIKKFHARAQRKIVYTETAAPMNTVADFYNEFLETGKRLPEKKIAEQWHDLLIRYVNDPDAKTFIARKYSGGKKDGEWNNRRGAVVRFADGFEVVYADNFLAHEIYLMAFHGFVPLYDDFKKTIENRELHITSGTEVEKLIRLYPSASKLCGCYLAHVVDVNGSYLRKDNTYRELSPAETDKIYPLGTPDDWKTYPDKICHLSYALNDEEKELVKAHFLRFLDPLNHFVTPQTKHCKHTLVGWPKRKNIGEYSCLTCYVQEQYKARFGSRYVGSVSDQDFVSLAKVKQIKPTEYNGHNTIDLEIRFDIPSTEPETASEPELTSASAPETKPTASHGSGSPRYSKVEYIPSDMGKFKSSFMKKGAAKITITYNDGRVVTRTWTCKKITQSSNIKGNLTSQAWYKKDKDIICKVVCEVV